MAGDLEGLCSVRVAPISLEEGSTRVHTQMHTHKLHIHEDVHAFMHTGTDNNTHTHWLCNPDFCTQETIIAHIHAEL